MSKGIKMLSAVDAHGMLHTVDGLQRRYDNEQAIPGLFCDSPNCGRDLHHHLLELRIVVQPYVTHKLSLAPVSKGQLAAVS